MASGGNFSEKPNLRPTKRLTAGGKSIFLHHNPNNPSTKSYIHARWRDSNKSDDDDPLGIVRPEVEYSLNKRRRWDLLNNFREHMVNGPDSSSDSDQEVQSDSEQRRKKATNKKQKSTKQDSSKKYRLYEFHNTNQQANCVSMTSNTGAQRVQVPQKTYMSAPVNPVRTVRRENNNATAAATANAGPDVTYFAVVPPPREKQLINIRKQHASKGKKGSGNVQRTNTNQAPRRRVVDADVDASSSSSTDDYDERDFTSPPPKPVQLQLNDFIPQISADTLPKTSSVTESLVVVNDRPDPKSSRYYIDDLDFSEQRQQFHRQISKEEKLYNRDMATYKKMQQKQGEKVATVENSHHHLMPMTFRSILIDRSQLTVDQMSKSFGKDFLHAQCYPNKYLIRLTDRLKAFDWKNKFELFTKYVTLNAYLIIIETESVEPFQRVQVALNMDLFAQSIEIENLVESETSIYPISKVVEKSIEFITTLPFDVFKPMDYELTRKKLIRNDVDSELSESEYLNKQIRHLQILDKENEPSTKIELLEDFKTNNEAILEDYELVRPDICTSCYRDMDESSAMTALKCCAHWFCNECWKEYLENSIKRMKIILCPEWNCDSIVDIGTFLSLTNVRCLNIYEGNIEKCLVNVSRSFVKCPAKQCSNIIQVIGPAVDHVRCRCSHQFCILCKQEPHFPATCNAYRLYFDEASRNGDLISDFNAVTQVQGRNCVSCNNFIEKNGGCNHMTCRCGAEFCWSCTAYWKDHSAPDGAFRCPREVVPLQEQILGKQRSGSRRFYYNAIFHRHERILQNEAKFKENAKRLLSTIPLEKGSLFDDTLIRKQIDKRESVLRHLYEMGKYIQYLHRVCEFIAVAADGYGNNPSEFRNSLQTFEILVLNMSQLFEGGRGHRAIDQLTELHQKSEKILERLRRVVTLRELRRVNTTGYVTS